MQIAPHIPAATEIIAIAPVAEPIFKAAFLFIPPIDFIYE